jgi:hypothetical protein
MDRNLERHGNAHYHGRNVYKEHYVNWSWATQLGYGGSAAQHRLIYRSPRPEPNIATVAVYLFYAFLPTFPCVFPGSDRGILQ